MHLRNREGYTPLFLAAHAGQRDHVRLLMEAGAHLHSEEVADAEAYAGKEKEKARAKGDGDGAGPLEEAIWALTLS